MENNAYIRLSQQVFTHGDFKLVPIRYSDKYSIMKWRNEQLHHLRQKEPLTKESQDKYFDEIVAELFNQSYPKQLLFSFLHEEVCIGYGGLVHINWEDKNAELSFIMNTEKKKGCFSEYWSSFIDCIVQLAFEELQLHKIFTYAFDIRPHLYPILERKGFVRDATLKDHCIVDGGFKDVIIHSLINKYLTLRPANNGDMKITFTWANNPIVRRYAKSRSPISEGEHQSWFAAKIEDVNCFFYIAEVGEEPVGSIRLEIDDFGVACLSYLVDPKYHGNRYGTELLRLGIRSARENSRIRALVGDVMLENMASLKVFINNGFKEIDKNKNFIRYKLHLE